MPMILLFHYVDLMNTRNLASDHLHVRERHSRVVPDVAGFAGPLDFVGQRERKGCIDFPLNYLREGAFFRTQVTVRGA